MQHCFLGEPSVCDFGMFSAEGVYACDIPCRSFRCDIDRIVGPGNHISYVGDAT